MKKTTSILFLFILLWQTELIAQGFKVSGTRLLDANQNEFVMRGINVPVVWYYNQSLANLENIRNNTKSNSIRIVWDLNNSYSDAQWQAVIQKCIDLNMIPMFELHDATCKNTESDLLRLAQWYATKAEYFKRPEIAKYVLINVANEWGDWYMNGETWRNSYLKAIKIIRDSGINTTLVIDGPDCGKNTEVVRWYGDDLLLADTQKNLLFGIHFYCRYTSASQIETELTNIQNAGLAVFAGEFGADHPNGSGGNCDIPEKEIMRICQQKKIGYMPWSWIGNNAETKMLDMSFDWAGTNLTGWGNTAVNDVNGIKNTSQVCSVFSTTTNPGNNNGITSTLINPNATKEAKALKAFLDDTYKNKMISGQYGIEWCTWVKNLTGETPAILGLDFMDITPVRTQNGANSQDAAKAIDWVNNKKGIATISWHWDAPKNVTGDWWSAFYTNATSFDLSYAMNNPGSTDYQLLLRDIDLAAVELKKLQDAGVPVLWRPLHEAAGGWFWWGAKGAAPCKKLWRMMYERLVNHHKLNNLIWVWNCYAYDKGNPLDWFPGNDMVDIISYDYPAANTWNNYNSIYPSNGKPFGLAEVGSLPDPDNFTNQSWLYFVTWVNFVKDNNTEAYVKKVFNHNRVVNLEDLPDLKNYGTSTPPVGNLAYQKPVTVSSNEAGSNNVGGNAVDGNSTTTRWSSLYANPQWISVDLGETYAISKVILKWEAAYGSAYRIDVSNDGINWSSIFQTTTGNGGTDDLTLSGIGRYIRMYGTQRATTWGYSLYEFEVYGQKTSVNIAPLANAGADQTKTDTDNNGTESLQLTGAASADSDGTIGSYVWSLNGAQIATGITPSITLPVGTHQITLEVTDNGGLKATDVVTIIVKAGQVINNSNLALTKPVTVSSTEANSGNAANLAVDGSSTTRWSSVYSDPQWIMVDLQANYNIQRVVLKWEAAYGKSYRIEVSNDATNWSSIYQTTNSDGATDELINLSGSGRYIRMNGTTRATQWGYSLYEFEVYGTPGAFTGNFEAETGILTGLTTATNIAGYSGTGFVTGFDNAGDKVRINFSVPNAGTYNLTIRNASPFGPKKNFVSVNGNNLGEIDFPLSTGWQNTTVNSITLNSGSNYIEISNSWGWFHVDRITLTEVPTAAPAASSDVNNARRTSVFTYPNPASESMTLEISSTAGESGNLILARMDGIVVFTDSYSNGNYELNLTNVPEGIYHLTVITGNTSTTKMIGVKK